MAQHPRARPAGDWRRPRRVGGWQEGHQHVDVAPQPCEPRGCSLPGPAVHRAARTARSRTHRPPRGGAKRERSLKVRCRGRLAATPALVASWSGRGPRGCPLAWGSASPPGPGSASPPGPGSASPPGRGRRHLPAEVGVTSWPGSLAGTWALQLDQAGGAVCCRLVPCFLGAGARPLLRGVRVCVSSRCTGGKVGRVKGRDSAPRGRKTVLRPCALRAGGSGARASLCSCDLREQLTLGGHSRVAARAQ